MNISSGKNLSEGKMSFVASVKKLLTPKSKKPEIVVHGSAGSQGPAQDVSDAGSVTSRMSHYSQAISLISSHPSFSPSKVDQSTSELELIRKSFKNARKKKENCGAY